MSWQNVLALAVFVGVCGFIAYIGDLLGRRMGKRRLSLFGLRPRYTAIVTTSITGMLIAIFTIAVMSAASKEVQQLVLRGAQVLEDLRITRHDLGLATTQVRVQKHLAQAALSEASKAEKQRDLQRAELARINRTLVVLRAELQQNRTSLARTQKTLTLAQVDLTSAKKEVEAKRKLIAQQTSAIAKLEANRNELQQGLEKLGKAYSELRRGRVIFSPNQDIARRVINCAQSKSGIRAELTSLLNESSDVAKQDGASIGKNGRAVVFLPKVIEGQKHLYLESEIVNAIADNIYSGSGGVIARIYAFGNAFEGEQAAVDCELIANRHVYAAGDEVASTVIDGSQSNGSVFSSLVMFLQSEVRYAAIYKGVVPVLDESGQRSVGQVNDWDKVFDLVLRIKAEGKKVRVRAIAARETWSVGPLPVDFTVSDL